MANEHYSSIVWLDPVLCVTQNTSTGLYHATLYVRNTAYTNAHRYRLHYQDGMPLADAQGFAKTWFRTYVANHAAYTWQHRQPLWAEQMFSWDGSGLQGAAGVAVWVFGELQL